MAFEFDPAKSAANKDKHGIDFVEAQLLWADDRLIETGAIDRSEPRRMAIGQIEGKCWTAIFTIRGDSIRIISVRRSRDKEAGRYEQ